MIKLLIPFPSVTPTESLMPSQMNGQFFSIDFEKAEGGGKRSAGKKSSVEKQNKDHESFDDLKKCKGKSKGLKKPLQEERDAHEDCDEKQRRKGNPELDQAIEL